MHTNYLCYVDKNDTLNKKKLQQHVIPNVTHINLSKQCNCGEKLHWLSQLVHAIIGSYTML